MLTKKCALSRTIGPPMTPPNSVLLVSGLVSLSLRATK